MAEREGGSDGEEDVSLGLCHPRRGQSDIEEVAVVGWLADCRGNSSCRFHVLVPLKPTTNNTP